MILNKNKYAEIRNNKLIWKNNTFIFKAFENLPGRFWYIELADIHCFTDELLDIAIPLHVQHLIKTSHVKLIVVNYLEGFHIIVDPIYKRLVIDKEIPEENIYFYSESANILDAVEHYSNIYNKKPLKTFYIRLTEFFTSKSALSNSYDISDTHLEKKFLLFNRRWRMHRPALIALLFSRNLLGYGYVSLAKELEGRNWSNSFDYLLYLNSTNPCIINLLQENKNKILNLPSLEIDTEKFYDNDLLVNASANNYYAKSMFSVISETNFYEQETGESSVFITEKTYKAISNKHPFIIVSTPNTLKALQNNGYKTFNGIINENYDSVENDSDRMLMIVDEIERLCLLNDEGSKKFIKEAHDITEYNYNVLLSRRKLNNCLTLLTDN